MRLRSLVPPFVVGVCLAAAGSISAGLLLYSGAGFLRAVASILATLLAALALGVWTGHGGSERDPVERVRRLWLLTLLAFTLAVVFSGTWELLEDLPAGRGIQGLGLAVLGALPLFAGGALVGAMGRADTLTAPGTGDRLPGPGSAALAGGAVGVVLAGIVLFPALSPTAMLLLGIVALSGAALYHGRMLDSRFLGRVVEHRWTPDGELRVVDEVRGRPRALRRLLLQDGALRGAEDEAGRPVRQVDRAVAASLLERPELRRVLFLGGGALTVPRLLSAERPEVDTVVVEPGRALVELARAHFPVAREQSDAKAEATDEALVGPPGAAVHHVGWWEAEDAVGRGFDVVVADVAALFPLSPVYGLLGGGLQRLAPLVREEGELLLAGVRPGAAREQQGNGGPNGGTSDPLEPLLREARDRFPTVRVLRTRSAGEPNGSLAAGPVGDRRDVLVLSRRSPDPEHRPEGMPTPEGEAS